MDPYEPPTRPYIPRPKGLSTLPTGEVNLPPKFLDQIKEVAPKKKRSKVWLVVLLLALAGGGVWLGLTAKGRALVARARHGLSRPTTSISMQAPIATESAPTPATATASVTTAASETASATASAPETASATPTVSASAAPTAKPAAKHRKHH